MQSLLLASDQSRARDLRRWYHSRPREATRSSQLTYFDDSSRTTIISWICKLLQLVHRRANRADMFSQRRDRRA